MQKNKIDFYEPIDFAITHIIENTKAKIYPNEKSELEALNAIAGLAELLVKLMKAKDE